MTQYEAVRLGYVFVLMATAMNLNYSLMLQTMNIDMRTARECGRNAAMYRTLAQMWCELWVVFVVRIWRLRPHRASERMDASLLRDFLMNVDRVHPARQFV